MDADALEEGSQDRGIGPASEIVESRFAERAAHTLLDGLRERANAHSSGVEKGAIDIEEYESNHVEGWLFYGSSDGG